MSDKKGEASTTGRTPYRSKTAGVAAAGSGGVISNAVAGSAGAGDLQVGDRVALTATPEVEGTVRFSGKTKFAEGEWVGVELDVPKGKNDGSVKGDRYFECEPMRGVFVRYGHVKKLSTESPKDGQMRKSASLKTRISETSTGSKEQSKKVEMPVPEQTKKVDALVPLQTADAKVRRISAAMGEEDDIRVGQTKSEAYINGGMDPRGIRLALAEAMEERDLAELERLVALGEKYGVDEHEINAAKRILEKDGREAELASAVGDFRNSLTMTLSDFQREMCTLTEELKAATSSLKGIVPAKMPNGPLTEAPQSGVLLQQTPGLESLDYKLQAIMDSLAKMAPVTVERPQPAGPEEADVKLNNLLTSIETKLDKMSFPAKGESVFLQQQIVLSSNADASQESASPQVAADLQLLLQSIETKIDSMPFTHDTSNMLSQGQGERSPQPAEADRLKEKVDAIVQSLELNSGRQDEVLQSLTTSMGIMPTKIESALTREINRMKDWFDRKLQNSSVPKDPKTSAIMQLQALQRGEAARDVVAKAYDIDVGASKVKFAEAEVAMDDAALVAAALKVQAIQRGRLSSSDAKEVAVISVADVPDDRLETELQAATLRIQALQRGMSSREQTASLEAGASDADVKASAEDLEAAALKVQALQRRLKEKRSSKGKGDVSGANDAATAQVDAETENAARMIQAIQRGKESDAETENAAMMIQAIQRGKESDAETENAAMMIQAIQRGRERREELEKLRDEGRSDEACFRVMEASVACADEELEAATVKMRATQRAQDARDQVKVADVAETDAEMEAAALQIQALQRAKAGRGQIEKLKAEGRMSEVKAAESEVAEADADLEAAALKVQALQRGSAARDHIATMQDGEIGLEAKATKPLVTNGDKDLNSAALKIQAMARAREAREDIAMMKNGDI
jgi:hypothetical protein